jgi:serine/threonine protein kinase
MIAPASRRIGKYIIRHKLGRGGMADVYLADDAELGATVALKIIEEAPDPDIKDSIAAERRGVHLQAHLAAVDPRVVKIFDAGDMDGYFYVAMEYVDGQDLAKLMDRGPLETGFAVDVAIAVAETLEHAHELQVAVDGRDIRGIVHGDIKPKNIRIDSHGQVRVLDFGIAKALSLSRKLTRNEFGSVPYASPERLDTGDVNFGSDLWSLAVMLYEMVTGLQPYSADTTERLEKMIRSRVPPPPAPDPCPDRLRRILIKAMAPDPEARYQSAREFAAELKAFCVGLPVKAENEDFDSTRRTYRPPAVDDETRRTEPDHETRRTTPRDEDDTRRTTAREEDDTRRTAPAVAPILPVTPKRRTGLKIAAGLGLVLITWMLISALSSMFLYRRGQHLARAIESEQLTDPNTIWQQWTELSDGNPSSILLHTPRKLVKQKLVAAADHVIDTYRTNSDKIVESNWKAARDNLAHALQVDPDETVRGKLRVTEGHIARIDAATHKSQAEYNDSVAKFTEAEHLLPKSPDPELGLAPVYVYGLKDVDKARAVLDEATERGFSLGPREKSELADGYRERADRTYWESRNVRGLPQEKEEITRAKDDYEQALALYQEIAPWGGANTSIAKMQPSIESVYTRLDELEGDTEPTGEHKGHLPKFLAPLFRRLKIIK